MKIYVDGLILKEKLKHLLDEHKNFKTDLSLKELSDFLEKYQIDKPVEDRYDRSRKFIDWNNDKEGWPCEYLALVLIDDLDDFTYVFDMPPVTEVHRDPVGEFVDDMATKIVKNILEANRPKNIQLYEVDTKDIHYEPDYMLADETVGPEEEDKPVELEDVHNQINKWKICGICIHDGNWDQCTECENGSDFKLKCCQFCKGDECAWCVGYSKFEYNHELEELEDEEEDKVIELTLNDIAKILQGETINGVKLKKTWVYQDDTVGTCKLELS